jgi:hypothetical protein
VSHKVYTVTVEFDVYIKDGGQIVQNADSVTAAVRHLMRNAMPVGWRKNGMQVLMPSLHAEAKDKEFAQ